jgi:aspartate/tyrosine/aromatic aminotransferase
MSCINSKGKPLVLNVIKKAEQLVLRDTTLNKEYLAIDGGLKIIV